MSSALQEYDLCKNAVRLDGTRIAYVRNAVTNVVTVDFGAPAALPEGTSDLISFLDEFDDHPDVAGHMVDARRDIGKALEAMEGSTLRALRLAKGMSQDDFAQAIKTSQAAISAIENRSRKPGEETLREMARTLEVDFNTLMEALSNG